MRRKLSFTGADINNRVISFLIVLIIAFFACMTTAIFPVRLVGNAPATHVVEGVDGYASLLNDSVSAGGIYVLRGEWEFYPNELYDFSDFTNGRTGEPREVTFPHYWKNEPDTVIGNIGYATYRMRVRVPASFDSIGLYSRFQYSAYEIYLNNELICGAGVVSADFDEHQAVYLPMNGYTSTSVGAEGRTYSIIVRVQNEVSDLGGLSKDIFIGSAESVSQLRTLLLTINGFVSGGLMLLFISFLFIFLNGRDRKEYLDYTILALVTLFISLTAGGESLLYSIGFDSVLLVRLEYCAMIIGAFFANYSVLKELIKSKSVFFLLYAYIGAATAFFLLAPLMIFSSVRVPVPAVSLAFFGLPLIDSARNLFTKRTPGSAVSCISYIVVFFGLYFYAFGEKPWDSVDIFSMTIIIHCILQMILFLNRYRKTEQTLKDLAETLEERIVERTSEVMLMKEKAEAATMAKSDFLANMSHEIRTPMNAIMGISELMRTDNLDQGQLSYLSDIKKSSKALLQIINDILDFSKIEAGKLEIIPVHFNLAALCDNICSMCRFSANAKDLRFEYSFDPDIPKYVIADEVRYKQVLLNIVNNAIKYTKEGCVEFKTEKIEVRGLPFVRFTVSDTGIGIKPEDFARLFNSFEQLDSKSNRKIVGTGLGLSISKQLVSLMDGEIGIESDYGKGSVFTVTLPLTEGDAALAVTQEGYVPVMTRGARVLVVDDNGINLKVAEGFLALHGIYPDTALSGAEAIENIKGNTYDLVFMDHMMPEMDGVEATGIIRSMDGGRFAALPIIALTANAVTGAKEVLEKAGMSDFLSKPINAAQINAVLTRWLPAERLDAAVQPVNEAQPLRDDGVFEELRQIEGLDVSRGIAHAANSKSVYLEILRQFLAEFEAYAAEIESGFADGDWERYRKAQHAIKGVLANLGALKLSAWAAKLEEAAHDRDTAICQNETRPFCAGLRALRDCLATVQLSGGNDAPEKTAIEADELAERLKSLREVCLLGDFDEAEALQQELQTRSFSAEIDAGLDEVFGLIQSFDFEIVADKISSMLTRISHS